MLTVALRGNEKAGDKSTDFLMGKTRRKKKKEGAYLLLR